jgi:hypothetical protein
MRDAPFFLGETMSANAIVTFAQDRLDAARREIREAVIDFTVSDEKLLELRANARQAYEELRNLDRKAAKPGPFSFLKLW